MASLYRNSITNMGFIADKVYCCLHFHYLTAGPGHLYGDRRKSSVNKFSLSQLIHFFEFLNLKVHAVRTFLESIAHYHNVILRIHYILYELHQSCNTGSKIQMENKEITIWFVKVTHKKIIADYVRPFLIRGKVYCQMHLNLTLLH